jgi:3-phenylpropionate/trans-cinnamate dioxygenase ferredoxin component
MQSFNTKTEDATRPDENQRTFIVCGVDALHTGATLRFELPDGDELAIYNVNGEYYATDNSCPHHGAPLVEGSMCGSIVECGWHGWQFDVRTGECLTVKERIKTYRVRIEDGLVKVVVE